MTIEAIEIKNRLSSIGEAIGMIALEYIEKLEKENQQLKKENKIMEDIIIEQQEENEQLKEQIEKMKCCKNCKKYRMPESQVTLRCLKNQRTNFCCEDWELAE